MTDPTPLPPAADIIAAGAVVREMLGDGWEVQRSATVSTLRDAATEVSRLRRAEEARQRAEANRHVLVVTRDQDSDPEYSVQCPVPAGEIGQCAMWRECGCTADDPHDIVEDPCPKSPTREHRVIGRVLMMPTAECFVAGNDYLSDAAPDITEAVGEWPICWDTDDGTDSGLRLEPASEEVHLRIRIAEITAERDQARAHLDAIAAEWAKPPEVMVPGATGQPVTADVRDLVADHWPALVDVLDDSTAGGKLSKLHLFAERDRLVRQVEYLTGRVRDLETPR